MGKWAGKYVIGLTGNIGTGKSVVRRMLEHMGALGIDADAFSHRAITKGAPGYKPVVDMFGRWILGADGEIDRVKLGRLVFADKDALVQLERVVHPLVLQAVDWMIQRSDKKVIVIEAIKLIESGMARQCDGVWVVYAPADVQMVRLMQKRGMSEVEARQRITAQPPQEQKLSAASVVIKNSASFEDTWRQVSVAWQKNVPPVEMPQPEPSKGPSLPQGELTIARGKPRDSETIAAFINQVRKTHLTSGDIMAEFGDKAYLLIRVAGKLVGVAGWQVENLVARTSDIVLEPGIPAAAVLPALMAEMERFSKDLQCEASLVFTPTDLSVDTIWKGIGYERRTSQSLGVAVWQEAAKETQKPGLAMYFKQLRVDRVLRPI